MKHLYTGKHVIVRATNAGVFFGILENKEGQEVILKECRRLWWWNGACSISQIAIDGTTEPNNCKFTVTVDSICIMECVELIPCTDKAIKIIKGVKEWKKLSNF